MELGKFKQYINHLVEHNNKLNKASDIDIEIFNFFSELEEANILLNREVFTDSALEVISLFLYGDKTDSTTPSPFNNDIELLYKHIKEINGFKK